MRKPILVWHTTQFVAQLELDIPAKLNTPALAVSLSSHHYMESTSVSNRIFWPENLRLHEKVLLAYRGNCNEHVTARSLDINDFALKSSTNFFLYFW